MDQTYDLGYHVYNTNDLKPVLLKELLRTSHSTQIWEVIELLGTSITHHQHCLHGNKSYVSSLFSLVYLISVNIQQQKSLLFIYDL